MPVTNKDLLIAAGGMAAGIIIGAVASNRWTTRKLTDYYHELIESEVEYAIARTKRAYAEENYGPPEGLVMVDKEEKPPIDEVVERTESQRIAYEQKYSPKERAIINEINALEEMVDEADEAQRIAEIEEEKLQNIFEEAEWSYEAEINYRKDLDPSVPYIIHVDEFEGKEEGHDQSNLTYYEGDDVLADQRDIAIDDVDAVIGIDNLNRMGHGSNNPDLLYVRNVRLDTEYEISRDLGNWSDQVHRSVEHADEDPPRRHRKMRFDDEE